MILGASTVAIVAIAVVIVVALLAVVYIVPRGGRRPRQARAKVVVLVGLAGGALGSALTTLLTISHERAAELRAHMLNSADEFSTGTIAALQQGRNAAGEIGKDDKPLDDETGWFRPEIKTCLDSANQALDDALAKQARVHLLFGDHTPVGISAASHLATPEHAWRSSIGLTRSATA